MNTPSKMLTDAMAGVVWELNSGPWKRSAAYAARWRVWVERQAQDADAPLKLD
jgi:hypothetical protein